MTQCSICISDITFKCLNTTLACGHVFHPKCIREWTYHNNTCPVCRYELRPDYYINSVTLIAIGVYVLFVFCVVFGSMLNVLMLIYDHALICYATTQCFVSSIILNVIIWLISITCATVASVLCYECLLDRAISQIEEV